MTVTVLHRQSLLDLAIQHTGSPSTAFAIAKANGLSLSDELSAGSSILLPEISGDTDVLNYYKTKVIQPATALSELQSDAISEPEGIGYWTIAKNFKVS